MDVGAPQMEGIFNMMKKTKLAVGILFALAISSCTTLSILKYEKEEALRKNSEFEKQVIVKEVESAPEDQPTDKPETKIDAVAAAPVAEVVKETTPAATSPVIPEPKKVPVKAKPVVSKPVAKAKPAPVKEEPKKPREPSIEDRDGFEFGSRTPKVSPFTVGEKIIHSVTYFGAEAGKLTLQTKPMVEVNGKSSYNFYIGLKTSLVFSRFYAVDDYVETYVDAQEMVPYVFKINIRESGKLSQAEAYFNHKTLTAQFWERKYTEKKGEEEKKLNWEILSYSQNAFSGIFYMRIFEWKIGKEYSFRVADDGKNIVFKGKAISKEKLSTDAGDFDTIKIQASVVSRGMLTQSGDFFLWVSDDDRKLIIRTEAAIKIGKLVSEIVEYQSGKK